MRTDLSAASRSRRPSSQHTAATIPSVIPAARLTPHSRPGIGHTHRPLIAFAQEASAATAATLAVTLTDMYRRIAPPPLGRTYALLRMFFGFTSRIAKLLRVTRGLQGVGAGFGS